MENISVSTPTGIGESIFPYLAEDTLAAGARALFSASAPTSALAMSSSGGPLAWSAGSPSAISGSAGTRRTAAGIGRRRLRRWAQTAPPWR